MVNLIERRQFWADVQQKSPASSLLAAYSVATEVVGILDAAIASSQASDLAHERESAALRKIDRFAEDAHSAGAERDRAYQAIGRVRDLVDLWEMQGDNETAMLIRRALDDKQ